MNKYNLYITFIILLKAGFIILALTHLYFKFKHQEHSPTDEKVLYWKERIEFIFIITMALLLIYIFNPRSNNLQVIDKETKILFYLFGFILLITAKWDPFMRETKWYKYLQEIVK
jgi:hypothetical protein